MIAIQDHGTNESSLETLPLFGAIKRRKFLKICCNLIDTNRSKTIPWLYAERTVKTFIKAV